MNIRSVVSSVGGALLTVGLYLPGQAQTWFLDGEKLLETKCIYAAPTWHDVDGDGENELIVGAKRRYLKPDGTLDYFEGRAFVLRNDGTAGRPAFSLPPSLDDAECLQANGEDIVHLQDASVENYQGCWGMQAAFGDVDGDGNEDLVLGGLYGELTVYRGTGTPGSYEEPEYFASTNPPLRHVKRSHVGLWDMDGDGRDELIVGYMNGISDGTYGVGGEAGIAVYRYEAGALTGGETLKDAAGVELNSPNKAFEYGGPTPAVTSRMGPSFADMNGDGLDDLVSGSSLGGVFYYPAEATNVLGKASSWSSKGVRLTPDLKGQHGENPDAPARSRVFATDMTGDGVIDLLVGYADGTVYLYRGTETNGFNLPETAYTNLVAGVKLPTTYGTVVGVKGTAKVVAKSLPSGISLKKNKSGKYYLTGTPTAVQTKTASFVCQNSKGKTLATTKVKFSVRAPQVAFAMEPFHVVQPNVQTNLPVVIESECPYTVKASGIPAGLKLVRNSDGTYRLSGKPTSPGEKTVTLKVFYATNLKTGLSTKVKILTDNLRDETIPLEDHYDEFVAGIRVSGYSVPGAVGCTASLPKDLGLVFNARTGVLSGTPLKPGKYLATFTRKICVSAPGAKPKYEVHKATALFVVYQGDGDHTGDGGVISPAMSVQMPDIDTAVTNECLAGVKLDLPIEVSGALDGVATTLKATGLPKGLSCKNGRIVGTPQKAGVFTVKVAASNAYGWTSEPYSFTLKVGALPGWARGTFTGAVTNDVFYGTFTLTVSSAGAISGKIVTSGKTYSFKDTGYAGGDETGYDFEKVITVAGITLPVSFSVEPDIFVLPENAPDGVQRLTGCVIPSDTSWLAFDGGQNIWKRSDAAKYRLPVFLTSAKKTIRVTRGSLTLAFGKNGSVKMAGKIDGKKVSGSTQLEVMNFDEAQCGCFWMAYNCRVFINVPSVVYFTCVDVTISPGNDKKSASDINIDCKDHCYD